MNRLCNDSATSFVSTDRQRHCCVYPGCLNSLELLPKTAWLCSDHQIALEDMRNQINGWLNGRKLPKEDIWFLFEHSDNCSLVSLANYLEVDPKDIADLPALVLAQYEWPWSVEAIPLCGLAGVLDLVWNWISLSVVARLNKLNLADLAELARDGKMGPIKIGSTGNILVLRSEAKRVVDKIRQEGIANLAEKYTAQRIALLLEVGVETVYEWKANGYFGHQSKWYDLQVGVRQFQQFLMAMAGRRYRTHSRLVMRCRQLILEDTKFYTDELAKVKRKVKNWLGEEDLPEDDWQFLVFHQESCCLRSLRDHLQDVYRGDFNEAARAGRLKARKIGREWYIVDFKELVLLLSTLRNWVSVYSLALISGVDPTTFYGYMDEGLFGEVRTNLSGARAVDRKYAVGIKERCEAIKKKKRKTQGSPLRVLRAGEMSTGQFADRFGTDRGQILIWKKRFALPYEVRERTTIFTLDTFWGFVTRVAQGDILSEKYVQRSRQLLQHKAKVTDELLHSRV